MKDSDLLLIQSPLDLAKLVMKLVLMMTRSSRTYTSDKG